MTIGMVSLPAGIWSGPAVGVTVGVTVTGDASGNGPNTAFCGLTVPYPSCASGTAPGGGSAVSSSRRITSAGVRVTSSALAFWSMSATTPVTIGAAKLVPGSVFQICELLR